MTFLGSKRRKLKERKIRTGERVMSKNQEKREFLGGEM